jgi:hypothetical protein
MRVIYRNDDGFGARRPVRATPMTGIGAENAEAGAGRPVAMLLKNYRWRI